MVRALRPILCSFVCALALACSAPPQPDKPIEQPDAGAQNSVFTDLELSVIRAAFGHLPESPPPDPTNRVADDPKATALGQKFFFDKRFSSNGQVACVTCHAPDHAFMDPEQSSMGIAFTGRHAPTVVNASYGSVTPNETIWQFWDGRKDSVWSQALGPPENPAEMGTTRTQVALMIFDKYKSDYEAIFGAMPALRDVQGTGPDPSAMPSDTSTEANAAWQALGATEQQAIDTIYANFGKAIAAYERKLVNRESPFDQFWDEIVAGESDSDALTDNEKIGLKLFVGRAGCVSCHEGPNLTDARFHNIGVPQPQGSHILATDTGRAEGVAQVLADTSFNCTSALSDAPDKTKCAVATLAAKPADEGAFKTPSLRGIARVAPYFHTGGAATLRDVLEHYNQGGAPSGFVGTLDPAITPLRLSSDELDRIVDLLETFDGNQTPAPPYTTPPTLPP